MVPTIPRIELRMDDLERLVERARHTPLSDDEYDTLKAAIHTLGYVAQLVEEKGATLAGLRQMLFGARTEKTRDVLKRAGVDDTEKTTAKASGGDDASASPTGREPAARGHGRHGVEAYEGAIHVEVPHAHLNHGDRCPECAQGTVYRQRDPGVLVRMVGQRRRSRRRSTRSRNCAAICVANSSRPIRRRAWARRSTTRPRGPWSRC